LFTNNSNPYIIIQILPIEPTKMPNLQASIKDLRQSKTRTVHNNRVRRRLHDVSKKYNKAIDEKDVEKAKDTLPRVQKMLDKAAKRGIIKKGTASRKKSGYAKKLNDIAAPDVKTTDKNA
jgi:small subunit ribosomal protein S20